MKKIYLSVISLVLLSFQLNAQQVIFNGNYSPGIAFAAFGGSTNSLSIDPTQPYSGQPSLEIPVPASGYTGGALVDSTPINLTAYNAVTFWVKSSIASTLDVSGFGNNALTAAYATEFDGDSIQTTWTKIIIPIPDPSKLTSLAGLFHFAQGSQHGAFTIWMNDIQYENITGVIGTAVASMATQTVTETVGAVFTVSGITVSIPVNGISESLTSVAPVYYSYASSTAGIVSFDALGNITAVASGSTNVTAKLGSVNVAGTLTVNVSGLTGPTTPAPTPKIPASDVIALYNSSHVYVDSPIDAEGWIAPWCNAKLTDPYVIPSTTDSMKEFYNLVYSGTEFTTHEINATAHKYFHIDVWTPNVQSLSVKLVDFAPSGAYNSATNTADQKTFTLTPGVWTTLVVDLDSLPGLLGSYNYMAQLLLVDNDNGGAGGGSIYFDNVYFSSIDSAAAPATAPITPAPTPTIPAADVIALYNSSHVYVDSPIDAEGWIAPWCNAKLTDPYIIPSTTDSMKEFYNLVYSGTEFTTHEINATAHKYFHIDVWTPNVQSLSVKLVDFAPSGAYNSATNTADQKTFTLTPGVWTTLVVDLDSLPGLLGSYNYMAQLLLVDNDNGGAGGGSIYFDNVYFSSIDSAAAPATAPITPAPTPTIPAADVIALYNSSHVYVDSPIDAEGWIAPWCNAKLTDPYIIPSTTDSMKEFYNLAYSGTEFTTHEIDATSHKYFHIDVWSANIQNLSVKLVDFAPSGAYNAATNLADLKTFTLTPGTWNSLVIDLDSLPGLLGSYNYMAQLLLVDNDNGGAGGGSVYFDNVYFASIGSTVPLTFLSFEGQLQNNIAVLNWSTANEYRNKGFEVQRSTDGKNFTNIGFVAGNNIGGSVHNYSYSDHNANSGDNYYRLEQIDLLGNYHYSSIIKISTSSFNWSIIGNPSSNSSVQLQLDKLYNNISMQVVSVSGKVVQTINKTNMNKGTYNIPIELNNVASGLYIVRLQIGNDSYSKKLIKL